MSFYQSFPDGRVKRCNKVGRGIVFLTTDLVLHNGGIQKSGLDAVSCLLQLTRKHHVGDLGIFTFLHQYESKHTEVESICANGVKIRALKLAIQSKWKPKLILCWHVNLLPIAAFIRKSDTRVLVFLHGVECWRKLKIPTRLATKCVNAFLSNSDFTWSRFIDSNPQYAHIPHRTVPLGLDNCNKHQELPAPPSHSPAALILGRMNANEDYKGHRELIRAWPLVMKQIPQAQFWIAGDGDLRQDMESMVRSKGLEGFIHFFGKVSEKDKIALLQKCWCLAMPSRGEGFGLVYLEAMRFGRPCLVSNQDAGCELICPPECGLAADPDDIEAIADCLVRMLTYSKEWQQWSRNAEDRYKKNYTADHFYKRLGSVCEEYLDL